MNKKNIYWICQIGGWLLFVLFQILFFELNNAFNSNVAKSMFLLFFFGIFLSQLYRFIIIKLKWLNKKLIHLIPRVIISIIILGFLLEYLQHGVEVLLNIHGDKHSDFVNIAINIGNASFVFFFWSLIYFSIFYLDNYKKAEIENLKWEASKNEIELNKLKSQLNPHFMFNAMNSIRALVDENPEKSKNAITQLSNLLRNTLQMGKNKVIPFDDEFKLVEDYLELESIRYEERLKIEKHIHADSKTFQVPPLMLQTLVENGIKHGISKLPEGGVLKINTNIDNQKLIISIINSGKLSDNMDTESGFGIKNTIERLKLLYGDEASLSITNDIQGFVKTVLIIPSKLLTYEGNNN